MPGAAGVAPVGGGSGGIWIGSLKVNSVDDAASVNVGPKLLIGARSVGKTSSANGTVYGDFGTMSVLVGWVHDPDLVDAPSWTYLIGPGGRGGG